MLREDFLTVHFFLQHSAVWEMKHSVIPVAAEQLHRRHSGCVKCTLRVIAELDRENAWTYLQKLLTLLWKDWPLTYNYNLQRKQNQYSVTGRWCSQVKTTWHKHWFNPWVGLKPMKWLMRVFNIPARYKGSRLTRLKVHLLAVSPCFLYFHTRSRFVRADVSSFFKLWTHFGIQRLK